MSRYRVSVYLTAPGMGLVRQLHVLATDPDDAAAEGYLGARMRWPDYTAQVLCLRVTDHGDGLRVTARRDAP